MRKLYALSTVATLYLLIVAFLFIFFGSFILEPLMMSDGMIGSMAFFIILIGFAALGIICGVIGIISSIVCFVRGDDPLAMAKTVMIVKLCLVPAYIVLFGLGFGFFCGGIFTLAFLLATILADYCVLLITGFFNTLAILRAIRSGKISLKGNRRYVIMQLVYCLDVIASVLFFRKLKKLYSEEKYSVEE